MLQYSLSKTVQLDTNIFCLNIHTGLAPLSDQHQPLLPLEALLHPLPSLFQLTLQQPVLDVSEGLVSVVFPRQVIFSAR